MVLDTTGRIVIDTEEKKAQNTEKDIDDDIDIDYRICLFLSH